MKPVPTGLLFLPATREPAATFKVKVQVHAASKLQLAILKFCSAITMSCWTAAQ